MTVHQSSTIHKKRENPGKYVGPKKPIYSLQKQNRTAIQLLLNSIIQPADKKSRVPSARLVHYSLNDLIHRVSCQPLSMFMYSKNLIIL